MDININQSQKSVTTALKELRVLPIALEDELFRHYPATKLGVSPHVEFYSEKLYEITKQILLSDPDQNWVITAPAYYHLPAAANLMARDVHQLLQKQGFNAPLVEPRLQQKKIEFSSEEEFKKYLDYSKNNLKQRIAERQRVQQLLQTDKLKTYFENRSVIIINDINVTGTQQHFMQQEFDEYEVTSCHWLYIFNVDNQLAEDHPEVEYQINNSQLSDINSFAAVLADENTRHTARCISRLFNESLENFDHLINSLSDAGRERIFHLAEQEGRFNSPIFREKMQVLVDAQAATQATTRMQASKTPSPKVIVEL
ncbi:MAG: phosphoribosyltransferase family protein [Methylococcales bacterium]|nr:hypothetical protein [Methylococcales bacterium]